MSADGPGGRDADGERDVAKERAPDGGRDTDVVDELFAVIEDRKRTLPEGSYTTSLLTHEKGENAVLEKLGEEVTELILAAKDDDRDGILHEGADLVYHLLVLLSLKDVHVEDLRTALRERRE